MISKFYSCLDTFIYLMLLLMKSRIPSSNTDDSFICLIVHRPINKPFKKTLSALISLRFEVFNFVRPLTRRTENRMSLNWRPTWILKERSPFA